ncbi:uncharacterized protein LOC141708476 [Apium graveolens]|uniref:uncharacterized protein LOC141708476 n=1 Tax=Apium graveolens TaxID=4045 RepID=UPI003D7A02CE
MLGQNLGKTTRTSYANVVMNTSTQNGENRSDSSSSTQRNIVNDEEVSIESNLHPLYLQNIDHPGLVLIAKKLTGTDNFGPWKRSITIALSAKNKIGIVNGSYPRPNDDSPLKTHWDRVNDMVISWIMNTVSDEISNGMDFVTSAQDLWNELHDQFSSVNGHKEDREQRKKLLQFLMGLNDSYSTARGQILMMSPLPTISQAFSLIKQDEK